MTSEPRAALLVPSLDHDYSIASPSRWTYRHALVALTGILVFLYLLPVIAGFPLWPGGSIRSLAQLYPHTDDTMTFETGYRPLRSFIAVELAAGRFPLWMPYQMLGYPLLEQYEYQLLNPLEWLNWLGTDYWWTIVLVAQLTLAATGVIAYCRRADVSPSGALAAAALYCGAGFTSHFYLTASFLTAVPIIPWLFYCASVVLAGDIRPRVVVGLIASMSGMVLCGQPQITFCVAYFSAAFCVILFVLPGYSTARLAATLTLALAAALALLITLPQTAPFTQAVFSGELWHTHEIGHWFGKDGTRALINLFNIAFPYSLGVSPYAVWTDSPIVRPVSSEDMPIGLLATGTFLALIGLMSIGNNSLRIATGALFLFIYATVICHGYLHIRIWPVGFVTLPRYSAPLLAFLGAVLAGVGIDSLSNTRRVEIAAAALLAMAVFVSSYLLFYVTTSDLLSPKLLAHVIVLNGVSLFSVGLIAWLAAIARAPNMRLAALLVLIGDILWQFRYGFGLEYDLTRLIPHLLLLASAIAIGFDYNWFRHGIAAAIAATIALWAGHRAIKSQRIQPEALPMAALAAHRTVSGVSALRPNYSAALRVATMSSRYPIQFKAMRQKLPLHLVDFRGFGGNHEPKWDRYCALRDTFRDLSADTIAGYNSELDRLFADQPDCRSGLVLVERTGTVSVYRDQQATPRAYIERDRSKIPLSVSDLSPLEVVVHTRGFDTGLVVLNDQYFKPWRAYVDGRPADIHNVNGVARGVDLTSPSNEVRFRYQPRWTRWFFLSGTGFLGTIALAAFWHRHSKSRAPS